MHNKFNHLWTEVNRYQTEILKILRQGQNKKYEKNIQSEWLLNINIKKRRVIIKNNFPLKTEFEKKKTNWLIKNNYIDNFHKNKKTKIIKNAFKNQTIDSFEKNISENSVNTLFENEVLHDISVLPISPTSRPSTLKRRRQPLEPVTLNICRNIAPSSTRSNRKKSWQFAK